MYNYICIIGFPFSTYTFSYKNIMRMRSFSIQPYVMVTILFQSCDTNDNFQLEVNLVVTKKLGSFVKWALLGIFINIVKHQHGPCKASLHYLPMPLRFQSFHLAWLHKYSLYTMVSHSWFKTHQYSICDI